MDDHIKVAACAPEVRPGDIEFNISNIRSALRQLGKENVDVAVFPEMCITGYTCADLFQQELLLSGAWKALESLLDSENTVTAAVGLPVRIDNRVFNCAAIVRGDRILGLVPKTYLPNYGEFYERRWFAPATDLRCTEYKGVPIGSDLIFRIGDVKFGVEICEDLWVPTPPSNHLCESGAQIILNLSASDELIGKNRYLRSLIENQSARCRCGYVYASAGTGESSTDLAFAGNCIIAENGRIASSSERFTIGEKLASAILDIEALDYDRLHHTTFNEAPQSTHRTIDCGLMTDNPADSDFGWLSDFAVDPTPFVPTDATRLRERCDEISSIQAWGLAMRLRAIRCRKAVVGISGGLDSTLALLVTVKAFDMLGLPREGIIGITMPGFGTTKRTHSNASDLMRLLGVTEMEIPIGDAVRQHFKDIGHDGTTPDVTYENSQARERTQILMDIANQTGAIVVGTGDLSELALGWCTYNGDQMSMYAVNASIPKTLVKYLVRGYAENAENPELRKVLEDIIDTPISPELLPADKQGKIAQKTEDLVGPYELHDFFLFHTLRYGRRPAKIYAMARKAFEGTFDAATIKHWLLTFYRRFFNQQFKRSCMPDGVKVGNVCLSPRGDWRMPSDASSALWIKETENLKV